MKEYKRFFKWNTAPEIWGCSEEHRTKTFENQSAEEIVNAFAEQGWEVVACSDNSFWLARDAK